jgi:hypothetical protein
MENGYVESFNGRFRDECLNENWFSDLADAREKIARWKQDYNEERPHSSLQYRTPVEFAAQSAVSFYTAGVGQGVSRQFSLIARFVGIVETMKHHAEGQLAVAVVSRDLRQSRPSYARPGLP